MSHSAVRLAVADDDASVLDALVDLVRSQDELALTGVASDHAQLLSLVERTRPDVVLMDIRMPNGHGPDVIRRIRRQAPRTAVVAVSAMDDRETVLASVEAGAAGYLVKGGSDREVVDAVMRAHRGQFSIPVALVKDAVAGVAGDLEHCRHVEEALRRSENTLHDLLDRAPAGVLLVGPGDSIRLANAQADRIFGSAAGSLAGTPASTLLPDRCVADFLSLLARATDPDLDLPAVVGQELVGLRADGAEFPAVFEMAPVVLEEQRYVGVFIRDLTSSEDVDTSYRRLVESSPDAVLLVSLDRRIDLVNAAAERLFGYERGEMLARPLELVLPGSPAELFQPPEDARAGADGFSTTARRHDAVEIPVDVRLGTLRNEEGTFIVATVRNMSEARRHERVLEQSFEYLRDIDRAHHQLLSYLVRTQEDERKRITVGIHDDTLQAMTAASLRVQQLRRRLDGSSDLEVADKLEETIQLSIARLRHLMFELRPPASAAGGLGGALNEYLDELSQHGGLQYRVQDDLALELSEETQVIAYRIAQEALTNVWLHAEANLVLVHVSAADDGCLVVIEDDGRGYEPAEAEGRRDHLGLTLMQERAHIAGGWCRIESAPGEGTTVQFWLPRSSEPADLEQDHPLLFGGTR